MFFILLSGQTFGKTSENLLTLIISNNYRPYIEAAEEFQALVSQHEQFDIAVYFLGNNAKSGGDLPWQRIEASSAVVVIGPEALDAAIRNVYRTNSAIFYMMVTNPRDIIRNRGDICGLSLNIPPPAQQMRVISERLPSIKRIGLLFDPVYNEAFYREAVFSAGNMGMGMEIAPLTVSTKKEIPRVLDEGWGRIDALWLIPDHTVTTFKSESLIRYIIKEGLLNNCPVIGYNRFFYQSGASVTFVYDYSDIGRQAARKFLDFREAGKCSEMTPEYIVLINDKVLSKIGVSISESIDTAIEVEP